MEPRQQKTGRAEKVNIFIFVVVTLGRVVFAQLSIKNIPRKGREHA